MGLTKSSVSLGAVDSGLKIKKNTDNDIIVALAGNPNVGKSTVFNGLTGMNQHTGNWSGKTVSNAQGYCVSEENSYILVDIPGTYSLLAHSAEEEVARNFICFGGADIVAVVCDATCLERNLNLVLQTLETTENTVVCLNLMDEAQKKGIEVDTDKLSSLLGVRVVSTVARTKKSLKNLLSALDNTVRDKDIIVKGRVTYPDDLENAISMIELSLKKERLKGLNSRWVAIRLIEDDTSLIKEIKEFLGEDFFDDNDVSTAVNLANGYLHSKGINKKELRDMIVSCVVKRAEEITEQSVLNRNSGYSYKDRKADKFFTGKYTAYPIMCLLLGLIFWITISAANYPSELLSLCFNRLESMFSSFLEYIGAGDFLRGMLSDGMFRVLSWVVAVMLPPMAIFFPLFTLLEDAGYLPRVAYNLDNTLKKCNACGKQAITMCMGFGCNAAGIVGCRIIDSPRERMLAILTNNFLPCNGRFPTLIAIIGMFFVWSASGFAGSLLSAFLLTLMIVISIIVSFAVTRILSKTLLKGVPSSFTLELPPYRRPQIGSVLLRSMLDRTLFVLGRAAAVAAPAGIIIWILSNVTVSGDSLIRHLAAFLDPFARIFGLDGVILIAFILGFPANEIVLPIALMTYMASGSITEVSDIAQMRSILVANGWTQSTAISVVIFSLMHWPCSTSLITVYKETKSIKWTAAAFFIPTAVGLLLCFALNFIITLFTH